MSSSLIAPCPLTTNIPVHWIEIELLGEDGKPIPDEPYGIQCPNGSVYEGNLDRNGFARHDGIDAGTCLVWFRQLAGTAWDSPVPSNPVAHKRAAASPDSTFGAKLHSAGWISIALVGEDGRPVEGERYEIQLPDGKMERGILDEQGEALLVGIPQGTCQVSFPDLEKSAWEPAGN